MSSFIYTLHGNADPGHGWILNDPIFDGPSPSLGACVPNIRRSVQVGDWVFAISGRVRGERQFIIGGFRVAEKIDHLAAYNRYPEYRLSRTPEGQVTGNIIVAKNGSQHPLDNHENFERRVQDYLIGDQCIFLSGSSQYDLSRSETLGTLSQVIRKQGNRVFDLIGRHKKLTGSQAADLRHWLDSVKERS